MSFLIPFSILFPNVFKFYCFYWNRIKLPPNRLLVDKTHQAPRRRPSYMRWTRQVSPMRSQRLVRLAIWWNAAVIITWPILVVSSWSVWTANFWSFLYNHLVMQMSKQMVITIDNYQPSNWTKSLWWTSSELQMGRLFGRRSVWLSV